MFDRILVVTLSNIGDAAMTTPVFETLHQLYPNSVIDIVGDERSSGIFLGAPYLGVTYHRRKKASLWENMRLVGRLRRQKYDLIVDLRTNLIPILLRGKRRFYKRSRSGVSQHSVEEHMSAISSLINKEFVTPPCKIYIDKEEARKARAVVSTIPQGRWLAVAPGANWPGKKWAAARYRELIFKLDGQFDVITCWDYIDHVLEPRKVIENLSKYLKKGGLFFFAINNRDCLSAKIMHENCPIFIGPHHTMHYGIEQLKKLMPDYELVESESYVSELNWISNWLNFQNPELGDSKLMFELFDPKKICELGMGIKLNAIFKKL